MSFFVIVKGCVNFHEITPLHKKRVFERSTVLSLGAFSENDRILSNLIPPYFYYLTNLVSGAYAPVVLNYAPWSTVGRPTTQPPYRTQSGTVPNRNQAHDVDTT
jgi:hypothetical protein